MEKSNSQNSSLMGTVGTNTECLFWPTSANERMIQENIKKIPKGTQTTLMPPLGNGEIPRSSSECKMNAHAEIQNDSLVNASLYESFSVDESKYDSFDDSLNEEAHQSPPKINASNFLSEQVNVTVRKVRDRQKMKGSYLCDSLEDICSLVSNAEHISNSDEIEYISNILEKHGIYEDSLRNDICYENRNASLNEQNFDDDSLAILEIEKPFDDSLEDVDVVSCVDSLMILGNSIGDGDVMVDKLISENCGARNHLDTSVQVIYENAPISSDESFQTAENFNSNKNSLSLSDCAMSRDSLEEIHDISEIASSGKSSNIPLKATCDVNEPSPGEKSAAIEDFNDNVLECKVKQTSTELSPTLQNRVSTVESERTSSVANSCYFYDTFCLDDSVQLPPGFNNKESIDTNEVTGSNYLNKENLELVSNTTKKLMESSNECHSLSNFQDMGKRITENSDTSNIECDNTDITDDTCTKPKEEAFQIAVMSTCDVLNKNLPKFEGSEIIDTKLSSILVQTEDVPLPCDPVFESECSQNNATKCTDKGSVAGNTDFSPQCLLDTKRDELKIQVMEIGFNGSDQSSKLVEPSENVSKLSYNSVSNPIQISASNITTCVTVSPFLGKLAKHNATATKGAHKYESDQKNLKLHIELAINKNCDVNVVSVSSMEQEIQNGANKTLEKSYLPVDNRDKAQVSARRNQTNQLETVDSKNEIGALEKIVTEACKKIPTLPKISEHENSYANSQKFISTKKICIDTASNIHNVQLLKALDLHDSSISYTSVGHLQSRDSIMPLNLCTRDLSPEKRNNILESKENIPYFEKCKKSPTDDKGTVLHSKNKPFGMSRDFKKTSGKPCLITKIPIRKVDSPLSMPVNQKQVKQDVKSSPCGKQMKPPIVKSTSIDSIGKLDKISRNHHFCTIRNSICRVPKSLEKPNAKKFQNIESPVAKYIGNNKIHSPLKPTHRYDENLVFTLPSRSTSKTTSNLGATSSEVSVGKKCARKL